MRLKIFHLGGDYTVNAFAWRLGDAGANCSKAPCRVPGDGRSAWAADVSASATTVPDPVAGAIQRADDAVIQLYGAGRLTEAAAAAEQAVAIREKALGRGFGEALNAPGDCLQSTGAERRRRTSIHARRGDLGKTLGSTHPNVALALNNLGAAYEAQGKYGQAEAAHRRALKIREAVLAPDHVTLAQTYNNLANVFRAQARFDEAEALHRRPSRSMRKISAPTISRLGSRSAT